MKKVKLLAFLVFSAASPAFAAPDWCKGASFDDTLDAGDLSSDDPEKVVVALAQATCAPTPETEAHASEIEASRQAWGKRLGMSDADWGDVLGWVQSGRGRRVKLEPSTKDATKLTPIDQYVVLTEGFPRPGGNGNYRDPIYIADALDANLSQVGRYAYVRSCLALEADTSGTPPAASWALCQEDLDRLDVGKLGEDLRADTAHGGDVKMQLRFELLGLKARLAEHAEHVQAAWKLDPVYKQMFETAAAGRRDWDEGLGKNRALTDLALQMDSAFWSSSRRQLEGCEEKTAAALVAAVGKVPAATFKAMKDERFDPYGGFATTAGPVLAAIPEVSLAAAAYVLCQPTTGTGDFLAVYLQQTVGYRGPRTSAFSRMLAEKLTLDDLNARVRWPETERPYVRRGGTMGSAGGVIAAVKPDGDTVTVTLERFIVKQNECIESHRTNKLRRIQPDGTLEYELICDKMGIVSHDQTWGDFHIRGAFASLLKPGVKFSSVNGEKSADVIVMWPSKTAEMPSWLLGASLK